MALKLTHMAASLAVALAIVVPTVAAADDDGDHDRARELYEHGEIRGLGDVLRSVEASAPGDVVSVDLIRVGDAWVYRLQIVASDGHRSTVDVNAGTGAQVDCRHCCERPACACCIEGPGRGMATALG